MPEPAAPRPDPGPATTRPRPSPNGTVPPKPSVPPMPWEVTNNGTVPPRPSVPPMPWEVTNNGTVPPRPSVPPMPWEVTNNGTVPPRPPVPPMPSEAVHPPGPSRCPLSSQRCRGRRRPACRGGFGGCAGQPRESSLRRGTCDPRYRKPGQCHAGLPRDVDGAGLMACGRFLAPEGRYFPGLHVPVPAEDLVGAALAEVQAGARWVS
jgi:hypothetical protein